MSDHGDLSYSQPETPEETAPPTEAGTDLYPPTIPPPVTYAQPYPQLQTSGKAITSMVLGILGICALPCYFLPVSLMLGAGAVFPGMQARKEIARNQGQLLGDGMALAGIITGWISLAVNLLSMILIIGFIIFAVSIPSSITPTVTTSTPTPSTSVPATPVPPPAPVTPAPVPPAPITPEPALNPPTPAPENPAETPPSVN